MHTEDPFKDYKSEFKDDKLLPIQERIENKVVALAYEFKTPTKAYLGKREFDSLCKELRPLAGASKPRKKIESNTNSTGKIVSVTSCYGFIQIISTRHKSYFRVV